MMEGVGEDGCWAVVDLWEQCHQKLTSGAFQIEAMDLKQMRRVLMQLGLPSSGTPSKLQSRLLAIVEQLEAGKDPEAAIAAVRTLR